MSFVSVWMQPFFDYGFMRRSLVACLALGLSCGPLGTLLVLRRMSLLGDSMAHALLPGAALGFIIAGFSLPAMAFGGFLAAMTVALAAGAITRITSQKEDASFAAFYLIALALGVMLIATHGSNVDLIHVLFGSVLAGDDQALILMASVSSVTLLILAVIYRPLIVECLDPIFLSAVGSRGAYFHLIFLVLVVLNMVSGFQALGTLMSVGLMMLPAAAARFWAAEVWHLAGIATLIAVFSGWSGLLISYHADLPSGPAIVLIAGMCYLMSVMVGRRDGLIVRYLFSERHQEA